jgi:hypothetical protein
VKERHWNSLVAAVRRGQCVLVLGPEVPATWSGAPAPSDTVVDALATALAGELAEDGRRPVGHTLAALAQQYEDSEGFGASALRAEAARFYRDAPCTPSPVHEMLAALPFPLVLTTTQDDLLLRALQAAGKAPIAQRYHLRGDRRENPEFALPGVPQAPLLYHLFGRAVEPASLVLSENDVLDFLIAIVAENPPLPNSLLRELKKPGQSFLFVGFGIRHWHLRVLLKVILRSLAVGAGGNAIAAEPLRALAEGEREDTILFYQRGTRIEVEDSDIASFLQGLGERFAAEGGYIGESVPAGRRARVFVSYAREDHELAARLHQALQAAHFDPWMDREALVGGEDWDLHIETELQGTDFALVLYTPTFARKTDSYVNKELALARRRALNVRGSFLIPLATRPPAELDEVRELAEYQQLPLRDESFDADVAKLVSTMAREMQRRQR